MRLVRRHALRFIACIRRRVHQIIDLGGCSPSPPFQRLSILAKDVCLCHCLTLIREGLMTGLMAFGALLVSSGYVEGTKSGLS